MTVTRSGARLGNGSRVIGGSYGRAKTRACDGDYIVRRCEVCGARMSVMRLDSALTCGERCQSTRKRRKASTPIGRATRWRALYDAARAANGQWVVHVCVDKVTAERLAIAIDQRRDFQAVRDGLVVSIRLVVAA